MGSGAGFYVHGDLERTKKRRNKRTPFDKNQHYYKDEGIKKTFPKVSEIQLNAIREKIKKQERKERDKLIISFILAIPASIGLLYGIVNFWIR
ncbi:hypothetical protein [uncultured Kordia sp.]|uniref:hypothetical protein n=1 Tax=uncultured Kordia sp. TaxID=507699 RepID=UPI002638C34E|nr:hypothetical protein [uncultured Kordia sp.]